MRISTTLALWLAVSGTCQTVLAGPLLPEDAAKIVTAGQLTAQRLETTPVTWKRLFRVSPALTISVQVERADGVTQSTWRVEQANLDICRIVATRDEWNCTDFVHNGVAGRYRPNEFPWPIVAIAMFHGASEPDFIDAEQLRAGDVVSSDASTIRLRLPHPAAEAIKLQIASARKMIAENSGANVVAQIRSQIDKLDAAERAGTVVTVDRLTGMIREQDSGGAGRAIEGFQFLQAGAKIGPDSGALPDHTNFITTRPDVVLLQRDSNWKPGSKSKNDLDTMVVDLQTGDSVRLPCSFGPSIAMCVSANRQFVYASTVLFDGRFMPVEINLKTGENRLLGEDTFGPGTIAIGGCLTPKGDTLVVTAKVGAMNLLERAIFAIDLKTGRAKQVTEPRDVIAPSFLADGKTIVVEDKQSDDMDKPSTNYVATIDESGKVKRLFQGSFGTALPGDRILFKDIDGLWYTIGLDVKDKRRVGDGIPKAMFPAVSPDGKRVVLMQVDPAKGPRPIVVDLESGSSTPIPVGEGLWAMPVWR